MYHEGRSPRQNCCNFVRTKSECTFVSTTKCSRKMNLDPSELTCGIHVYFFILHKMLDSKSWKLVVSTHNVYCQNGKHKTKSIPKWNLAIVAVVLDIHSFFIIISIYFNFLGCWFNPVTMTSLELLVCSTWPFLNVFLDQMWTIK